MKKQFIYLILAFLFTVSNVSFGHSHYQLEDYGEVAVIAVKQGNINLDFVIPQDYFDKNGNLLSPMTIDLSPIGEPPIYTTETTDMVIYIPNLKLEGKYKVTLTVGKHSQTIEISF